MMEIIAIHINPYALFIRKKGGSMIRAKPRCLILIAFLIFLIVGCAQPTRLEKSYGKSVRQAQSNQILNPETEINLEPVMGMDGKAAQTTLEQYRKTFDRPRASSSPPIQTGIQTEKVKE